MQSSRKNGINIDVCFALREELSESIALFSVLKEDLPARELVDALVDKIEEQDFLVRVRALQLLSLITEPNVVTVELLARILDAGSERSWVVREALVQALASIGLYSSGEVLQRIIELLSSWPFSDSNPQVRNAAACAFEEICGTDAVIRKVSSVFANATSDYSLQVYCLDLLALIPDVAEGCPGLILAALEHSYFRIRLKACRALEDSAVRDSIPVLIRRRFEPDHRIQQSAKSALSRQLATVDSSEEPFLDVFLRGICSGVRTSPGAYSEQPQDIWSHFKNQVHGSVQNQILKTQTRREDWLTERVSEKHVLAVKGLSSTSKYARKAAIWYLAELARLLLIERPDDSNAVELTQS